MLYSALWRVLPGSLLAKVVQALALVVLVVAVLFAWVFPRVATHMPFNENTVGASSPPASAPALAPAPAAQELA